ncbi:hypothetical protein IAQ67_28980 (plasmid) [Paenibacillus peoriae]|uniref:Uncharacterized protein n=1 Tax=Paenibacillus peoriae TaxID=59893 RepID=A0A7H0YH33_9BACL|nr:hypothetical protein [Paenibacillus peoriae]QNR70391.1 hypothetical protein IAQ67_28980 [Paenibacillus peoriae]
MKDTGIIVSHGGKIIYVFGKAVSPYEDLWEDHSYIGINLDTGRVDDIRNNYPKLVRFEDLTDEQQLVLSQHIPIRHAFSTGIMTISALARSGKDMLADSVCRKTFADRRSLADPIREIASITLGEVEGKNRESLILIGQGLRREDPNIWIKVWLRREIEATKEHGTFCTVVPDVRQPNEFTFFKSLGALTVKIETDEKKRLDKIREVDGETALNEKLLNDETESHVEGFETDLTIFNDYDEHFIEDIDNSVVHALKERGW